MKIICWNGGFEIKAENEQDATYFTRFIENLDIKELLSGHLELKIGNFDSDGKLEMYENNFNLIDYKDDRDGDTIYVETNHKEHYGETGKVVVISIRGWNNWMPEYWIKLLEKELKRIKR